MIKKIVRKIIDDYYADILYKHIEYIFLLYMMDSYIEIDKDNVIVYGKDMKLKNEYYKQFMVFKKCMSLDYLIDFKELEKNLKEQIKKYKKEMI